MLYRIIGSLIIVALSALAYVTIVSNSQETSQPVQQNQVEDFKSFKMQ
jgi:ABC-type transport system involved in cytochrome c biogenesis permease subunit